MLYHLFEEADADLEQELVENKYMYCLIYELLFRHHQ